MKSSEEQRLTDRELGAISSDLSTSFGSRLDSTLKQELASCILPREFHYLECYYGVCFLNYSFYVHFILHFIHRNKQSLRYCCSKNAVRLYPEARYHRC